MKELFELSFTVLWVLVFLESAVLIGVLKRSVAISRLYQSTRKAADDQLPQGSTAPEFTARMLGDGRTISTADLKGQATILLFISPDDVASFPASKLAVGTHALWHKSGGRLYLSCSGGQTRCAELMRILTDEGLNFRHIPWLLDDNRQLAESFLINDTPQAVMLDAKVRVDRYGHLLSGTETSDGAYNKQTRVAE